MNLHTFINANMDAILKEWEAFARTLLPSAATMDALALRDHAKPILEEIARDIVERGHGGRISVNSTVGVGTTFRVELPTTATHPTSWRSVVLSKKLTSLVPPPPAGRIGGCDICP